MPAVHSDLKRNINILVLGLKNDTSYSGSSIHRELNVLIKQPRISTAVKFLISLLIWVFSTADNYFRRSKSAGLPY